MSTPRIRRKLSFLAVLAAGAMVVLGSTEVQAQMFRNRGPFGNQYRVKIKERVAYPGAVRVAPYPAQTIYAQPTTTYYQQAPTVVSETQYIQPAPVVQSRVYQPAPVVESRVIQPPPVVERRLVQPPPVVENQYIQPAPYVEQRSYTLPAPY